MTYLIQYIDLLNDVSTSILAVCTRVSYHAQVCFVSEPTLYVIPL